MRSPSSAAVAGSLITGRYYTVPRPQDPYSKGSSLLDYFEFDWKARRYNPNKLVANGVAVADAANESDAVVGKAGKAKSPRVRRKSAAA